MKIWWRFILKQLRGFSGTCRGRILVNIYFLYSANPEEVRSEVLNFLSQLAEWIAAVFDVRIDFRRQSLTSVCFKGCCCLAMQREHLIPL